MIFLKACKIYHVMLNLSSPRCKKYSRGEIFIMDGIEFARFVETELATRGIKKGDFYSATGISATALYNWKRGRTPSMESVTAVEDYLGVKFSDVSKIETTGMDANLAELLDSIRSRPDLGVLLRSARDVPPSSVYQLVAQLEKEKERNAE